MTWIALVIALQIDDHIKPGDPCRDEEFLRRASLDIAGVAPAWEDAKSPPGDRAALVDKLVASEEFNLHWARFLLELTTERRAIRYDEHNGRALHQWLAAQMRAKQPYDRIVHALITAKGTANEDGATNFLLRYQAKPSDATGAIGRAFLGARLQCAQCHDHPFDKWTRDEFWGAAAFFARTKRTYIEGDDGNLGIVDIKKGRVMMPGEKDDGDEEQVEERRKVVAPKWIDGTAPGKDRPMREQLAELVTASPTFAPSLVNRVWARMTGRGFVEPLDGFGRRAKAERPELLAALAEGFAKDFDLRKLVRTIALSKAYARAGAPLRPLSVDQMHATLVRATGYHLDEDGSGGEEPEGGMMEEGEDEAADYADQEPADMFPGAPRTMRRSLNQLNGGYMHDIVEQGARHLMKQMGRPVTMAHVERVYLALLTRRPSKEEAERLSAVVKGAKGKREALEDILWAVLNSVEFQSNH